MRRTEASCDLNRKRGAVAAPPVRNAATTNTAKPAAIDRNRRAADSRAAGDAGRLADDAGRRAQDGPRGYRTDQRAKDDNADRNASRPGTYAVNRKTLDFSLLSEFSIGTTARMMLDQGCLELSLIHIFGVPRVILVGLHIGGGRTADSST